MSLLPTTPSTQRTQDLLSSTITSPISRRRSPRNQRGSGSGWETSQAKRSRVGGTLGRSSPTSSSQLFASQPTESHLITTSFGSQPDLDISSFETKGGHVLFRRDYAVQFKAWIESRLAQRRALNQVKPGEEKVVFGDDRRMIAAWGYYDEAATVEGVPVIICQLCDKVLVHGSIDGTAGMTKHLKSARCATEGGHRGYSRDFVMQNLQSGKVQSRPVIIVILQQLTRHSQRRLKRNFEEMVVQREDFEAAMIDSVISAGLPMTVFENTSVRRMLASLDETAVRDLLPATTVRRRIQQREKSVVDDLRKRIQKTERIAIAIDGWSALGLKAAFLAIKGYWIDSDWVRHEELLGFPVISGNHTGANLGQIVNKVITRLGCQGKLIAVTTDNASNNNTMVREVEKAAREVGADTEIGSLRRPSSDAPPAPPTISVSGDDDDDQGDLDEETLLHFPCISHVMQLVLGDLFGKLSIRPSNRDFVRVWDESSTKEEIEQLRRKKGMVGIPYLLAKVSPQRS